MLPLRARVALGAMSIKGYYAFPIEVSSSDCLVSYSGHSSEEFYPSAEVQLVYSAVLADWAIHFELKLLGKVS